MKKYSLIILFTFFSLFVFSNFILAQENISTFQAPGTLDEAKTLGLKILTGFSEVLKGIWQEALEIWKSMFRWLENFWNTYIQSHIINVWNKIKNFFSREIETRRTGIEEELKREKEEMRTEIPKAGRGFWERFREIIRW